MITNGKFYESEFEGVDMPATQFQLLASLLRREIRDYSKINQSRAQHFDDMLAQVIDEYNSRTFIEALIPHLPQLSCPNVENLQRAFRNNA